MLPTSSGVVVGGGGGGGGTVGGVEPSDEALAAAAAREGSDGPAFTALVERFRLRVWNICYRLVGNEADAHDAAQDVFVALFMQRGKFRGDSKYSTWVHAIAVRTSLMLRRSRGRRQRRDGATTALDLDTQPGTRNQATDAKLDVKLDLVQMLDILDEEDRALVLLKYTEGYEYEELAEIFELSVSACKMRVSRSREKIQERFAEK